MLHRLYADNYKCLVNFELKLDELTLLLGVNGAGKSSVFDLVFALRQLLTGAGRLFDPGIFPTTTLTRWQSSKRQTVECGVRLDEDDMTYHLEIEHDVEARKAHIALERLSAPGGMLFEFAEGEVTVFRDDYSRGVAYSLDWSESALARVPARRDNRRLTRFLEYFHGVVVCALYPRGMVPETLQDEPTLARDGANFVSWYRHAFQERQDLLPAYLKDVQEALDGLHGIRLERLSAEARAFLASFDQAGGRFEVRLDELSDGERAMLVLYALIRSTEKQGAALFLDEPDNYVALPELQPWLLALKEACGDSISQAVISSHHPELIDYLGTECGVWLSRVDAGPAQTSKVSPPIEGALKLSEMAARGWAP